MSFQGIVKSFNMVKGWGFISHGGKDIFLHSKDCNGKQPNVGSAVWFDFDSEKQKPGMEKAVNITFGEGTASCFGVVKSFVEDKGWGFVEYNGQDVFLHQKHCITRPKKGDSIQFDVEENPNKPGVWEAKNVSVMQETFGGQEFGGQETYVQETYVQEPPVRQNYEIGPCSGVVKSIFDVKNYGFIDYMGQDVFLHGKHCTGVPKRGDTVFFEIEENPTKPGVYEAKKVTGCSGGPSIVVPPPGSNPKGGKGGNLPGNHALAAKMSAPPTGSYSGVVKSFAECKNWGFVEFNGMDIFLHGKHCIQGIPRQGDTVYFEMEEDPTKPGKYEAKHVMGGSGPPADQVNESRVNGGGKGKGKGNDGKDGKGKGKDRYGPMSDPWQAAMAHAASPYPEIDDFTKGMAKGLAIGMAKAAGGGKAKGKGGKW